MKYRIIEKRERIHIEYCWMFWWFDCTPLTLEPLTLDYAKKTIDEWCRWSINKTPKVLYEAKF